MSGGKEATQLNLTERSSERFVVPYWTALAEDQAMLHHLVWLVALLGVGVQARSDDRDFHKRRPLMPVLGPTTPGESALRNSYFSAMRTLAASQGIPLLSGSSPALLDFSDSLRPQRFVLPAKIYRPQTTTPPSVDELCLRLRMC